MNRQQHATLARLLVRACGGLEEAARWCRIGKSQLGDCQAAHGEAFMPADVILDLEAHCGDPLYTRAMAEAHGLRAQAPGAACLKDEACEAAERVTGLQALVRQALKDGELSPRERGEVMEAFEAARRELADVGALLGEAAGGGRAGRAGRTGN